MHFSRLFLSNECVYTSPSYSSWCRTIRTWKWEYQRMSSARPSSRKNFFLSWNGDFLLGCIDEGLLLLPLPPPLLSRRPGLSRFVEAHNFWPPFQRCSKSCEPSSWYSTARLGRFEAHVIEVLFLLAQFWTVTHHPRITLFFRPMAPARTLFWWSHFGDRGSRRLCGRRRKPRLEPDVRSSRFVIVCEIPNATPF